MTKPALGFIGLGAMGMPIAQRLLAAGYPLTVWGRTPARLQPALDAGARLAPSARGVAEAAELVHLCVFDAEAVESVVFGPDGVAAGAGAGTLVVDHSTIHPEATRRFAERLYVAAGMGWVDAPVSGGAKGAQEGRLAVMAGGAAADVDRLRTVAGCFAARLTHMGPVGAGQAAKACNQMIIGSTVAVIAEALAFADKFGVSAPDLPDCLAGGFADSTVLQNHARRMAAADYQGAGPATIMTKDLDIALDMARVTGQPMPMTGLVASLYRLLIAQGDAAYGQIGLMRLYADAPLPRRPPA